MTKDELVAELRELLDEVRAMNRKYDARRGATGTDVPARNVSRPSYIEPVGYRESREELRAANREMREELIAMGDDIPADLRILLVDTDQLTSGELMKHTQALLAESAQFLKDELGIDDLEQRT